MPLGIPVLGALRRDDALTWRDRHLGLVPVVEHPARGRRRPRPAGRRWSTDRCDLDAIVAPRRSAAPVRTVARTADCPGGCGRRSPVRIAVAAGPAFSFGYPDNLEALEPPRAPSWCRSTRCIDARPARGVATALVAGRRLPRGLRRGAGRQRRAAGRRAPPRRRAAWSSGPSAAGCCGWRDRARRPRHGRRGRRRRPRMTDRLTLGYRTARHAGWPRRSGPAGTAAAGPRVPLLDAPSPPATPSTSTAASARAAAASPRPRCWPSYLHVHLGAAPESGRGVRPHRRGALT